MIPVDKTKNDPFYRYKMPEASVTHETSRTVIQNLEQIAKALSRNPVHILKFLSISFGCTCVTGQKFILNGQFETERIQGAIYDFIDQFVLCKECGNPETRFQTSNSILTRVCNSCGQTVVQENHKLNTQIMKDRSVNEDTKYETNNKSNIYTLIAEEQTERIYEIYKQESLTLKQIFEEYVKFKDLKQLERVLKEFEVENILESIEEMLEVNKKEDKIEGYLKGLLKIGFNKEEVMKYVTKPRTGKKRSPIIKKIFECFAEEDI